MSNDDNNYAKSKFFDYEYSDILEEESDEIVQIFSEIKFPMNFNNEFRCLEKHFIRMGKARTQNLLKNLYKHKLNVKFTSPFMYGGENSQMHRSFKSV